MVADDVYLEGISRVTAADIEAAAHLEALEEFAEQIGTDGDTLLLLLFLLLACTFIFFLDVFLLLVKGIFFVLLVIILNDIYQVKE